MRLSQEGGDDAPAQSSDSGGGTATQAIPREHVEEEPPNVHVQRLRAVGNFLIFRWDRLGGHQQQQPAVPGASAASDRGAVASTSNSSGGSSGGSLASGAQALAVGARSAASFGGTSLSRSNSGKQLAVAAAVRIGQPHQGGQLPGSSSGNAVRSHPAAGVVATLEASPRSPDGNTAQISRKSVPVRQTTAGLPASSTNTAAAAQIQQPQGPVYRPAGGMVVEEVFENERWQPFRGWGHTWPGHFLPTDPVRHWCDATAQAREGSNRHRGMAFEDAAPPLPDGWIW